MNPTKINIIENPDVFYAAMRASYTSSVLPKTKMSRFSKGTRIFACFAGNDEIYSSEVTLDEKGKVDIQQSDEQAFYRNAEEGRASVFDGGVFSDTFEQYLVFYDERTRRKNAKITDRFCTLATFRNALKRFMSENAEFVISEKKNIVAQLDENGKYVPMKDGKQYVLSETESRLFEFCSFIKVGQFWAEFGEFRDINRTELPLFIVDFSDRLDPSVADFDEIITLAKRSSRQTFVLKKK